MTCVPTCPECGSTAPLVRGEHDIESWFASWGPECGDCGRPVHGDPHARENASHPNALEAYRLRQTLSAKEQP